MLLSEQTEFWEEIFKASSSAVSGVWSVALRILYAGLLGGVVGFVYLRCTLRRPRTPGLAMTLVVLAMLISMMTLAIGDNVATAFTLVGTLAIVRFRTSVRDIRDTVFVIFAVAVGLAAGAPRAELGLVGTLVIAAAILFMNRREGQGADDEAPFEGNARLNLRYGVPAPSQTEIEAQLNLHVRGQRLLVSREDGEGAGTRLVYALDLDRSKANALVNSLHENGNLKRAALTFGDSDVDDD